MKRFLFLILLAISILSLQVLINCSSPLETLQGPTDDTLSPPLHIDTIILIDTMYIIDSSMNVDTVFIFDTIINSDTLFSIDTTYYYDTVLIIDSTTGLDTIYIVDTINYFDTIINTDTITNYDTVTIVDTIIVEVPDTNAAQFLCAQLASHRQEIVWLLQNDAGSFILKFASSGGGNKPPRSLDIEIDGVHYLWDVTGSSEFVYEGLLNTNSIIKINSEQPNSFGHAVDICLDITPL